MYNFSRSGDNNKAKQVNTKYKDEFEKKYKIFIEKYYGISKQQDRLDFDEISKINEFIDKKIKNIDNEQKYNLNKKFEINCPKCGCDDLNKNGISRGRQRYICKRCCITFDERSFSPLSNTKLSLEKWTKYLQLMLENRSIRNCAEAISVSVPTSFYMRHKILDMLNYATKDEILNGDVQVAFGFINESFKGARKKYELSDKDMHKKVVQPSINHCSINSLLNKNMHGKQELSYLNEKYYYNFEKQNLRDSERFLHNKFDPYSSMKHIRNSLICINTALDIDGNIITGVVDGFNGVTNEKLKRNDFISFFEGKFGKNVTLYTDHISTFYGLKEKYNIKLKQAVRSCSNSMNNVFAALRFNDNFKIWNRRFKGVATKYLNNYLMWFKFLFKYKEVQALDKVKFLLKNMINIKVYVSIEMIKNRKIEIIK